MVAKIADAIIEGRTEAESDYDESSYDAQYAQYDANAAAARSRRAPREEAPAPHRPHNRTRRPTHHPSGEASLEFRDQYKPIRRRGQAPARGHRRRHDRLPQRSRAGERRLRSRQARAGRARSSARRQEEPSAPRNEGLVGSYVHTGGKIGVLVEVNCETDFVARSARFGDLVKDVAMHIAAMSPVYVSRDDGAGGDRRDAARRAARGDPGRQEARDRRQDRRRQVEQVVRGVRAARSGVHQGRFPDRRRADWLRRRRPRREDRRPPLCEVRAWAKTRDDRAPRLRECGPETVGRSIRGRG